LLLLFLLLLLLLLLCRQHYSAARMSLVVLGGQDLDTLQSWVEGSFGPIPTATAGPPESFEGAGMPFEVGFFFSFFEKLY
jgi:hypothetical protein